MYFIDPNDRNFSKSILWKERSPPKYLDTLTPYHTCQKLWKKKSILLPIDVS